MRISASANSRKTWSEVPASALVEIWSAWGNCRIGTVFTWQSFRSLLINHNENIRINKQDWATSFKTCHVLWNGSQNQILSWNAQQRHCQAYRKEQYTKHHKNSIWSWHRLIQKRKRQRKQMLAGNKDAKTLTQWWILKRTPEQQRQH